MHRSITACCHRAALNGGKFVSHPDGEKTKLFDEHPRPVTQAEPVPRSAVAPGTWMRQPIAHGAVCRPGAYLLKELGYCIKKNPGAVAGVSILKY